ncbi:MAG: hypothetical protein ACHQQ3_04635 [Gemmatimonadales bacterium]
MTSRIYRIAAVLALATALAPSDATAQLGGLIKKAKETVDKAKDGTKDPTAANTNVKPLEGAPVTSDQLTSLLKGLTAVTALIDERRPLADERTALWDRRVRLAGDNAKAIDAWQQGSASVRDCQRPLLDAAFKKHQAELGPVMMAKFQSDPAAAQKFSQQAAGFAQRQQELMAKGDTLTAKKEATEFYKAMGLDLRPDTVAAEQKCGAVPAAPAAVAQIDDLDRQVRALNDRTRAIEQRMDTEGAVKSGMKPAEFATARERLYTWYDVVRKEGAKANLLTRDERDLFASRLAEIEKVRKAF